MRHLDPPRINLLMLGLLLVSGCTQKYQLHAVRPSSVHYEGNPAATRISLSDQRLSATKHSAPPFSHGRLKVELEFEGAANELDFFARELVNELKARGVPATRSHTAGEHGLHGQVKTFYIRNRRVSGFSPMITFTAFAADFSDGARTVRISAYSKHGKVPVWSMSELEGPCYNLPLKIVVGEVAAKINRAFFGYASDDQQVQTLVARTKSQNDDEALMAIYELGFTNNPTALPRLIELTNHGAETFRSAAISGIGVLGAAEHMPLLVKIQQQGAATSDRYAALKAIGDLGTPEALEFVKTAAGRAAGGEAQDLQEIADLYWANRVPENAAVAAVPQPDQEQAAPDVPVVAPSTSAGQGHEPTASTQEIVTSGGEMATADDAQQANPAPSSTPGEIAPAPAPVEPAQLTKPVPPSE